MPKVTKLSGVLVQESATPSTDSWLTRTDFTIIDNEASQTNYGLASLHLVGYESSGLISVTVTRPAGLGPETIYVSTGPRPGGPNNHGDYNEIANMALTFNSNDQQKTFNIEINNEGVPEPSEEFELRLWRTSDHDPVGLILRQDFSILDAKILLFL